MKRVMRWAVWALVLAGWVLAAGAAELKVDKKLSKVTVDVDATGDDFTAVLEDYEAAIALDDATGQPTKGGFAWDFKNLKTGKPKRDKAMLDWLDDSKHSKASFVFSKWETKEGKTWASGEMDLHGVKKAISFPVTIEREGGKATVRGTAKVDYRDFQLKIIRMMLFLTVDPVVEVHFELKGELVPPAN